MTEELHPSIKRLLEKPTTEDEQAQEMLRASFTRAKLSPAERMVSRGIVLAETALQNLKTAIKDGNDDAAILSQWHLADALALSGNYEGAALLHPVEDERKRYRDIKAAIEKPDKQVCGCNPKKVEINDVEIEVPNTNIKQMVFSQKHNDVVGLEVCKCGSMNARPLTGIQAKLASRSFTGKAEDLKGFRVIPDTEVLKVKSG